jgi:hypothetical protein
MRELTQEKKAITAQLKLIRAESSPPKESSQPLPFAKPRRSTDPLSPARVSTPTVVHHSTASNSTASNPKAPQPFPVSAEPNSASATRSRIQSCPFPSDRPSNELAATVERLKKQSEVYVRQFNQLQTHTLQTPREVLNQAFHVLEAHVQHINQLSAVQEAALVDLKRMAEKLEQDWATVEQSAHYYTHAIDTEVDLPPVCEYEATAVPQIEKTADGIYVLTARSIDLFKAEREANLNAEALRHWSNREPLRQSSSKGAWTWLADFLMFTEPQSSSTVQPDARSATPPTSKSSFTPQHRRMQRSGRRSGRRSARRNAWLGFSLREAAALFIGAFLLRTALNVVASAFPMLWTPAVALLVTPAAIAVYRNSRTSHSSLSWMYRILIIILGLLLGGKL